MLRQVLITGANSDIGIAVCRRYNGEGFRVIAHYRNNKPEFDRLRKEMGERLIPYKADFTDTSAVEQMLAADPDLFNATDILINMAAIRDPIVFSDVTPDDLLRHFVVNVIPMVMLIQRLGPRMAERGWGRIVNISSIGVKFGGGRTTFCYSLTKHIAEFIPAVYREWACCNVLVNAIRLGVTRTRYFEEMGKEIVNERIALIPAKRMATPEEMAEVIYWLGSEHNTFMTGQVISPSGGE
jgi:NAD(P)-dependent dehydrogenase (short-subunit alcohol dehydrogenase family)